MKEIYKIYREEGRGCELKKVKIIRKREKRDKRRKKKGKEG